MSILLVSNLPGLVAWKRRTTVADEQTDTTQILYLGINGVVNAFMKRHLPTEDEALDSLIYLYTVTSLSLKNRTLVTTDAKFTFKMIDVCNCHSQLIYICHLLHT